MDARVERIERRFEIPMLIAALLVIPAIAIQESTSNHSWNEVAAILNATIWLAFLAELIVMLSVVPSRRQWLKEHPLDVAIVLVTSPFVPAAWQSARLLR